MCVSKCAIKMININKYKQNRDDVTCILKYKQKDVHSDAKQAVKWRLFRHVPPGCSQQLSPLLAPVWCSNLQSNYCPLLCMPVWLASAPPCRLHQKNCASCLALLWQCRLCSERIILFHHWVVLFHPLLHIRRAPQSIVRITLASATLTAQALTIWILKNGGPRVEGLLRVAGLWEAVCHQRVADCLTVTRRIGSVWQSSSNSAAQFGCDVMHRHLPLSHRRLQLSFLCEHSSRK